MRGSTWNVGLVAVAAGVLVLTVLGAAVGGSWQLEERSFASLGAPSPAESPPPPPPVRIDPAHSPEGLSLSWGWLPTVGAVLLAALVPLAVWWLWLWIRQRTGSPRPVLRDVRTAAARGDEPDLPALRRGVAAARRSLAEIPQPADAVIAAWLALEDAAAASGTARAPSQTPTEFTKAVLDRTDADPEAATDLLALYQSARFSGHPISASEVARAQRCLTRIAASWDALAAAERSGP